MSLMPLLVLGPAVLLLWEGRSKETKGVKGQVRTPLKKLARKNEIHAHKS